MFTATFFVVRSCLSIFDIRGERMILKFKKRHMLDLLDWMRQEKSHEENFVAPP